MISTTATRSSILGLNAIQAPQEMDWWQSSMPMFMQHSAKPTHEDMATSRGAHCSLCAWCEAQQKRTLPPASAWLESSPGRSLQSLEGHVMGQASNSCPKEASLSSCLAAIVVAANMASCASGPGLEATVIRQSSSISLFALTDSADSRLRVVTSVATRHGSADRIEHKAVLFPYSHKCPCKEQGSHGAHEKRRRVWHPRRQQIHSRCWVPGSWVLISSPAVGRDAVDGGSGDWKRRPPLLESHRGQ